MNKNFKFLIFALVIITAIYIAAVAVPYFKHFNGALSNDRQAWGTFGDYIGGTLNPFLALLNLAVFVYLTFIIQHDQSKQEKKKSLYPFLSKALEKLFELQKKTYAVSQGTWITDENILSICVRTDDFCEEYKNYLTEAGASVKIIKNCVDEALEDLIKFCEVNNLEIAEFEQLVDYNGQTKFMKLSKAIEHQRHLIDSFFVN